MLEHVPAALAVEDLVVAQGATWSRSWEYAEGDPAALPAGWSTPGRWKARLEARRRRGLTEILFSAATEPGATGLITLSTNGSYGVVTVTLPAGALVNATWQQGVYDLELVDTGFSPAVVIRLVEGAVYLSGEVTTRA